VWHVSKAGTPAEGFGAYIDEAIRLAGYPSISAFARAADLDTSVVARWIRGETVPTAANLQKAAPALKMSEADLFAVAFPSGNHPPAFPIPDPIAELLDEYRLAGRPERDALLEQVRRISEWARYRRER
jgi:transcriptional regulator with XRE-family HTH domain